MRAGELSWNWWPTGISADPTDGDSLCYTIGASAVASSGRLAPFWLQSNRNGDVSSSPYSGNLTAGIYKPATSDQRWWDYDFAIRLTGRLQSRVPDSPFPFQHRISTGYFNEAYAHVRLYVFDITAGIKPMLYEMQDSVLSMGSMILSGNSQPMPRVTIGIDRYVPFPGLYSFMRLTGVLS